MDSITIMIITMIVFCSTIIPLIGYLVYKYFKDFRDLSKDFREAREIITKGTSCNP